MASRLFNSFSGARVHDLFSVYREIPGELKEGPTFKNSEHHEYCTNLNDFKFQVKAKDRSIFVTFLAVLPALKVSVNLIWQKFHVCRMTE